MMVISPGDRAILCFLNDQQQLSLIFPARVEIAPRSCVVLRCPRACIDIAPPSGHTRVSIRFLGDRARFLAMHRAVDAVDLDAMFPSPPPVLIPAAPLGMFDESLVEEQRLFVYAAHCSR